MEHSVAMSVPEPSLAATQSQIRTRPRSDRFVPLSHLRKLRECEQVAAVCYRVRAGEIKFLLVRTRNSGRWTFPKGSAEPGLTHAQAAALEAFEEAGVHGRIEEASFVTYFRRGRSNRGNHASRSGRDRVAVNAHLCEVLRLSAPRESRRNRTWFSVEDARQSLREGRDHEDGAQFVRVIDQAVARIGRWAGGREGFIDHPQPVRSGAGAVQKDALQKVQFEAFSDFASRQAAFMPNLRRQLAAMRQALPDADDSPEILPCEVLQFGSPREKKAKALGAGTNSKG